MSIKICHFAFSCFLPGRHLDSMGAGRYISCLVTLWTKPQVKARRTGSDMEPGPLVAFFSGYFSAKPCLQTSDYMKKLNLLIHTLSIFHP